MEPWGPSSYVGTQNSSASFQRKHSPEARSVLFLTNMGMGCLEYVLKNAF